MTPIPATNVMTTIWIVSYLTGKWLHIPSNIIMSVVIAVYLFMGFLYFDALLSSSSSLYSLFFSCTRTHTHNRGHKGQPMILLFLFYRRCHRKYGERIHRSCWIIITQWWKRISTKSTLILLWHWTTRKKSYLKITSELWTTNDRVWFMFSYQIQW